MIFFTSYLVGIFQLLSLFDASEKELGIVFKSFFKNEIKEDNSTFTELYIDSCFKNIPEFDFAFLTSILGDIPLNCCGFFIYSFTATIINIGIFLGFTKLDLLEMTRKPIFGRKI